MIKHWLTPTGYYSCNLAFGPVTNKEKVANTLDEVTCKNCLRKIKKVKIPVDVFKVFIRFKKDATHMLVRNVIQDVIRRKDKNILFLPHNVEVLVVNNKGETKVL